jgi:hypothetical protein
MAHSILVEQIPHITELLADVLPTAVIDSAYHFSRMLHGTAGSGDAFYRAFVPELGTTLYPLQMELVKRCLKNERGDVDRVGCTMFPGLVKVGLDNIHVRAPLSHGSFDECAADRRAARASNLRMCYESGCELMIDTCVVEFYYMLSSYTTNNDASVA